MCTFLCVCVRGVCCLYSLSACSSPQTPRASCSLGGLAHTQYSVCLWMWVCLCVVVWQLRKILKSRLHSRQGPNPHPLLQCTTFKYLTTALYWLLLHTHMPCFFSVHSVYLSGEELKMCWKAIFPWRQLIQIVLLQGIFKTSQCLCWENQIVLQLVHRWRCRNIYLI